MTTSLPVSVYMGVAHLLGQERGSQWLNTVSPQLQTRFAKQVLVASESVDAEHLPLSLEHGEDMWCIRNNLVQQCLDRKMHLPRAELNLKKEQFLQRYRHETRSAHSTPDIWQVLHLYALKEKPTSVNDDWSMPPPPPLDLSSSDLSDSMSDQYDAGISEPGPRAHGPVEPSTSEIHAYYQSRQNVKVPPGVLIVCFKTNKVPLSAVATLQSYVQHHGMTWVDMYFVVKPGKTLREEISRRFAGVRVQQFDIHQRRHSAITRGCLSPASVTPLTLDQRNELLESKELKSAQFPGTKAVSSQVDKSDPSDAYHGLQNNQVVQLTSRYSSEVYYRCVGNRK